MSDTSDKYLVVGNPVAHSRSPEIHRLFAEQTEQDIVYATKEIPVNEFATGIQALKLTGVKGFNVTVPFKGDAYAMCSTLSQRASQTGSVNTVTISEDAYIGDTTDGRGLINDLQLNHNVDLTNKNILILGAGGAVAGVIPDIFAQRIASLHIANRTMAKAKTLAERFSDLGDIQISDLDTIPEQAFDLIINATSASLSNQSLSLPAACIQASTVAYDMVYAAEPTPFLQWTEQQGARLNLDGLGMLVEQAAVAFEIWRGVKPETKTVIETVRKSLSA